jgi:outer membrane protein assembly factor BamB
MVRHALSCAVVVAFAGFVAAEDWPQWRGPDRTGISADTGLLKVWPKDGPPLRWKAADIGTGYSAPIVVKGRVYLQTTKGTEEFALALDEKTGKEIWIQPIGKVGVNKGPQYPGSRATPTADGDKLYCLASDGQLRCLEAAGGTTVWTKNLQTDFGGRVGGLMSWSYAESVLVDGDKVICTPGGDSATLLALDKKSGAVVWKSPVPGTDSAEYASVMPVETPTGKQYVQFLRKGVVGVDARTGKFLWRYAKTVDQGANMLTPVVRKNTVFTASTRSGGGLVELTPDGEGVKATEVFFEKAAAAGIGGAVLLDGYLYGANGTALFCADFTTGTLMWQETSVLPCSVCLADGRLYARLHKDGTVVLVDPSPQDYREKGRFKPKEGEQLKDEDRKGRLAWPHPVVANGGLYLRDQDFLVCYDVKAK